MNGSLEGDGGEVSLELWFGLPLGPFVYISRKLEFLVFDRNVFGF